MVLRSTFDVIARAVLRSTFGISCTPVTTHHTITQVLEPVGIEDFSEEIS